MIALLSVASQAAVVKPSELPRATAAGSNDLVLLSVTNHGAGTFTSKAVPLSALASNMPNIDVTGFVRTSDALLIGNKGETVTGSLNVKRAPFNAIGNGSADDTAALQLALNTANYSNGVPRRVFLPEGIYRLTSALIIPTNKVGIEIFGEGPADFAPNDARTIIRQSAAAANGFQFIASANNLNLLRLYVHDLAVTGVTNSSTGSGFYLGNNYTAPYGAVQFARFERVSVSGFANGWRLLDTVSTTLDQCSGMYNTNSGLWATRADTLCLQSVWLGWGPAAGDKLTAMRLDGGGWVTVRDGELGNCSRVLHLDTVAATFIGGNIESVGGTEIMLVTNLTPLTVIGTRYAKTSGQTVPLVRMTCNPSGHITSLINIVNPTWDSSTNLVSVEGNFLDLPHISMQQVMGPNNTIPILETHATIGGAVSAKYYGTAIPNINNPSTWTARQTFAQSSSSALRVQAGYMIAGLDVGADDNAATLSANAAKSGIICSPGYGGTDYTVAMMHARNYNGANALLIGGDWSSSQYGVTDLRLCTAPNSTSVRQDRFTIDAAGTCTFKTNMVMSSPSIPASAAAAGVAGQIAWDANYVYICTSSGAWKRAALSTW